MSTDVQFEENGSGGGYADIPVTLKGDFIGLIKRQSQDSFTFSGPNLPNGFSAHGRSEIKRMIEQHYGKPFSGQARKKGVVFSF